MNFQAVLAGLPDAVIAVDEALRVVFWNAAAEELTERSARRMEGRVLKEVFPPDASLVRRLSETLSMGLSRSETSRLLEQVTGVVIEARYRRRSCHQPPAMRPSRNATPSSQPVTSSGIT